MPDINPLVGKIRKRSRQDITIIDPELGECKFTIRPLSIMELSENRQEFENAQSGDNVDPEKLDDKAKLKFANDVLFPMIKKLLPLCVINPTIVLDDKDPRLDDSTSNVLSLNELPINLSSEVFNKILSVSGLTKKAEEDRKNLPSRQSQPQSAQSAK